MNAREKFIAILLAIMVVSSSRTRKSGRRRSRMRSRNLRLRVHRRRISTHENFHSLVRGLYEMAARILLRFLPPPAFTRIEVGITSGDFHVRALQLRTHLSFYFLWRLLLDASSMNPCRCCEENQALSKRRCVVHIYT
jgi:hypothetical protein